MSSALFENEYPKATFLGAFKVSVGYWKKSKLKVLLSKFSVGQSVMENMPRDAEVTGNMNK